VFSQETHGARAPEVVLWRCGAGGVAPEVVLWSCGSGGADLSKFNAWVFHT
jgi:hypothetical protein